MCVNLSLRNLEKDPAALWIGKCLIRISNGGLVFRACCSSAERGSATWSETGGQGLSTMVKCELGTINESGLKLIEFLPSKHAVHNDTWIQCCSSRKIEGVELALLLFRREGMLVLSSTKSWQMPLSAQISSYCSKFNFHEIWIAQLCQLLRFNRENIREKGSCSVEISKSCLHFWSGRETTMYACGTRQGTVLKNCILMC